MSEEMPVEFQGARPGRREARPWGWWEVVASGPGFSAKRLSVEPRKRLSLQWHRHRDEHWVVARGTARITVDGKTSTLGRGQAARVPRTVTHRIENLSSVEQLEIIEVQTGDYLGEDDIVRIEDDFGRAGEAATGV